METEAGIQTGAITDILRAAIHDGQFSPNERLIELELANRFKVNRAKVHTALVVLNQEGLVVLEPNRGARVRVVTAREALEIAETRCALEGMLAALAATSATPADHARLYEFMDAMSACIDAGDLLKYSDLNGDLHAFIYELSGNETARNLLTNLKSRIVRLQFRVILKPGRPTQSLEEHREIVDAICAGDPERADSAMRKHLLIARNALHQVIDETKFSKFG